MFCSLVPLDLQYFILISLTCQVGVVHLFEGTADVRPITLIVV